MPRMEKSGWSQNELVTYAGYIWNTNATDVVDVACASTMRATFSSMANGDLAGGWMSIVTTNLTLTPDRTRSPCAYNGTGGSGASHANHKFKDSAGTSCTTKASRWTFRHGGW